tara:strand:- start:256 stop:432 length:177 start_codon:yes stop_codon:yes gene_type:complete
MKSNAETPDFFELQNHLSKFDMSSPLPHIKKKFFFIFLDNLAKKNVARNSIKDKDFNF